MTVPQTTDWFLPLSDPGRASRHLYMFPQAGAGCTAFTGCADRLAPGIAVWGVNLPGRQARFLEQPRGDLDALIDDLVPAAGGRSPWVLFGYCSGALLAFLLARRLRALGRPGPAHLVVASFPAPDLVRPDRELHRLPADEFWPRVVAGGGVPPTVAAQPDFREIFEAALRADHELLAGYVHREEPPLDLPITVLVGAGDPMIAPADVRGWQRHTAGRFRVRPVEAGHWLLDEALDDVVEALREVAG